jgi:FkbM family methyltransferase
MLAAQTGRGDQDAAEWLRRLAAAEALWRASGVVKLLRSPRRILFGRLVDQLHRRFGWTARAEAELFWGDRMTVILPDPIGWQLYGYGFYEPDVSAFLVGHLRHGMVFLDIGAHMGYFALLASRAVGPSGQVHAFEPTPRIAAVLRSNTQGRTNVRVHQAAVWSEVTRLRLKDYGPTMSPLNSVLDARLDAETRQRSNVIEYEVDATTVDEYTRQARIRPDFVKIDAESAERWVLQGMQRTLREDRPVLSLEVGDYDVPGVPPSREVLRSVLACGYAAFEIHERGLRPHAPAESYRYGNLILMPA